MTIRYARLLRAQIVVAALLMKTAFAAQNLSGLTVEELASDSPGRKIGLLAGDRIPTYDGKTLPWPATLQALEQNTFGKKAVVLEIWRGGRVLAIQGRLIPESLDSMWPPVSIIWALLHRAAEICKPHRIS